jgi:hypothetical protein
MSCNRIFSFTENTCPNVAPYVVTCLGAISLAVAVAYGKSEWWNDNIGFKDKKWTFSLWTLIIVIFILSIVYMWVWYNCLCICQNNGVNVLFGLGFGFFFCSYIALFLYKDSKIAYWLAITALIIMLYQIWFLLTRTTTLLTLVMFIIVLFLAHYVYQLHHIKI